MLAMSIGAILTIAFWGSLLGFVIAAYIGVKNDFLGGWPVSSSFH